MTCCPSRLGASCRFFGRGPPCHQLPARQIRDRHPEPRRHRRRPGRPGIFRVCRQDPRRGAEGGGLRSRGYAGRRLEFKKALTALRANEFELSRLLLSTLKQLPGLKVYGPTDPQKLDQRVPTFSFTMAGKNPRSSPSTWLAKASMYGTATTTPSLSRTISKNSWR